ncbi:hypothetical protein ACFLY6_00130 [Candidatus Dependentiae bacterium]
MDAVKDRGDILSASERGLVDGILALPHKIVQNHHVDGLAQLVLYDISNPGRFGLKKAAYLVDNPDFDCLHGIAGFHHGEFEAPPDDVWKNPVESAKTMNDLTFNKNVRSFKSCSLNRQKSDHSKILSEFEIENPSTIGWPMKYGNHGIFIYESRDDVCVWRKSVLASIVALLGLCAI